MAKTNTTPFTQTLSASTVLFASSDLYSIVAVAANSNGTNLTAGTRTFTAAVGSGAVQTGGSPATWTATVTDSRVIGPVSITGNGTYTTAPSDVATNAAAVDSGSTNATWTLTAGVLKTLYTGQTNDSVVKAINVASFDSAARIMTLWLCNAAGTVNSFIGAVNIPATAGTGSGTTASIDLLGGTLMPSLPYDANGKRVLPIPAGWVLKASVPAVTAAKLITVQVMAEDY